MKLNEKNRIYQSHFRARVIKKPGFKQKFMGIIVDFGSSDAQQLAGGAHFLEHKLFSKEDGDIADKIEALGGDTNAFTSFNETMFYCTTTSSVNRFIPLLFRLVGQPYFTETSVKTEIPIIQQELAMYQDDPSWKLSNTLLGKMFPNSLLGIDVAGTQKSIALFTAKKLLKIYRQNYQPDKMAFVCAGDFSDYQVNNILRLVGQEQNKYFNNSFEKQEKVKADLEREKDFSASINPNLFALSIKFPNFKKVLASFNLAQNLVEIMLESRLSAMSPWFSDMKKKGLMASPLQISFDHTRQGDFASIFGISEQPQLAAQAVKEQLLTNAVSASFSRMFYGLEQKRLLAESLRREDDLLDLGIGAAEDIIAGENEQSDVRKLLLLSYEQFRDYINCLWQDWQIFLSSAKGAKK